MRRYEFGDFGIDQLQLVERKSPVPGPGEVVVDVGAFSLNFRDLLVVKGLYNPKLNLPSVPISDGAGVISALGEGVDSVSVGDRVMSHYAAPWQSGPFPMEILSGTLGTPGPGLAAEQVALPESAVVPVPESLDLAAASTLPIAALTAWSCLVTEGRLKAGQTVLTLGTGGVSIFAVQMAHAMGSRVIVTSSSDEKIQRAMAMGADAGVNYVRNPDWENEVWELTGGEGAHVVVENGGAGTLTQSLKAVRPGGTIAMLGALTGLEAKINIAPVLMKRVRIAGIFVDSRRSFDDMVCFFGEHDIQPVIDERFQFEDLAGAFRHMEEGRHFGKIVVDVSGG